MAGTWESPDYHSWQENIRYELSCENIGAGYKCNSSDYPFTCMIVSEASSELAHSYSSIWTEKQTTSCCGWGCGEWCTCFTYSQQASCWFEGNCLALLWHFSMHQILQDVLV